MHKKNFGSADFFRSRTRTKIGFFVCAICTNKLNKNSRFCATCPIRALALLCGIVVAHITFALAAHYPSLSLSLLAYLFLLVCPLGVYHFSLCVYYFPLFVCMSSLCACFVSLLLCALCARALSLSLCLVPLSLCAPFILFLFTRLFDLLLINSFIFVSY